MDNFGPQIFESPFIYRERIRGPLSMFEGIQRIYEFENGYQASVVCSQYSYGGPKGLWELAILKDGNLCYDTPISNDVIGYLNDEERDKILHQISLLPKPVRDTHKDNDKA